MGSREFFEETPQNNADAENEAFGGALPVEVGEAMESSASHPQDAGTALSDAVRDGIRDECARAILALTAFFDGEANDVEALLVRSHLEECARCELLQNSWAQQSRMLRDLTVPVPPGLLTRLLTVIRLAAAFPQLGARLEIDSTRFEPKSGVKRDVHLLSESLFAAGANPFAPRRQTGRRAAKIEAPRELPPLDPLLPPPPANLRDEILRHTIGSASSVDRAGGTGLIGNAVSNAEPGAQQSDEELASLEPLLKERRSALSFKARFSLPSTTLVPALAAWLMFLAGQGGVWAPGVDNQSELPKKSSASVVLPPQSGRSVIRPRATRPNATPASELEAAGNTLKSSEAKPVVVSTHEPMSLVVPDTNGTTEDATVTQKQSQTSDVPQSPTMSKARENTLALATSQIATVAPSIEKSQTAAQLGAAQATQAAQTTVARPVTKLTALAGALPKMRPLISLPKVTAVSHHTDVLENEVGTRRASWRAPISSLLATRRVTWAVANTPPAAQSDNESIQADAEILEHVNRLNDERPEHVRHVLDAYRASLLANAEEEFPSAEPQG